VGLILNPASGPRVKRELLVKAKASSAINLNETEGHHGSTNCLSKKSESRRSKDQIICKKKSTAELKSAEISYDKHKFSSKFKDEGKAYQKAELKG